MTEAEPISRQCVL